MPNWMKRASHNRVPALFLSAFSLALSISVFAAVQDPLKRAAGLMKEVQQYHREGRYRDAIPKAREALALREQALGPDHPEVATSLNSLAELLRLTGDYGGARPLYERALKIREQVLGPNHRDVTTSLNNLALVLQAIGDYAGARTLFERALKTREQTLGPNHSWVALSLNNLARLLLIIGDYAAAKPLYERALKIREQTLGPNHPAVAASLTGLGELLRLTGDYAGARSLHERALTIREQTLGPNHPDVTTSLNNLALVLEAAADYAPARALYERALRINEQVLGPNHPTVATNLSNLAFNFMATGDYAGARPLHERSLKIREQAFGPDHPRVAATLNGLGELLRLTGNYAAAKPLYERALKIREQALGPNHPDVTTSLNNLALLLKITGDYVQAKTLYERALRTREQTLGAYHPWVALNLSNLGFLLKDTGDYAAAKPLFERALKIREQVLGPNHPRVAESLNGLAEVLRLTRDYAGALSLHKRALKIWEQSLGADHPRVATSLNNIARLLAVTGDSSSAKSLYERALGIARMSAAREGQWRGALGLGIIYEREGLPTEALALYQEAVQTVEGLAEQFGEEASRAQFLQAEGRLAAYDRLARLLLKLHEQDSSKGYDQQAWAVLEAKKGRIVAEALAAGRPKLQDPEALMEAQKAKAGQDKALALERALREEQAKARNEQRPEKVQNLTTLLAKTKAEYLAQVQAFLARYPRYKTQFVDQQTVDPKALAKFADRLPAGTLAVQYFSSPDKLYLFVVAPGGRFQVKAQAVPQAELYALVKQYREHLERAATQRLPWADDGSEAYRREVVRLKELTRKLSTHLLEPIDTELRAYRNLILIPNDLLLYLPIHALTREEPHGSFRFLAETHAVSTLTQMELVDLLNPGKPPPDVPLLAVANPDGSLPGASREVRALTRTRPSVTALEGPQATKAHFLGLAARFPDLHLATHGVLDPRQPERSYLLMAGDDESSQRLDIEEITGLSLRNGLVILSACETALGEQVPGAALITLAAAFSQAGAESILASLWKVNDAATRDFMVAFHGALPKSGRAAALREAQITVLKNPLTAHPYYWAPFILIGAR